MRGRQARAPECNGDFFPRFTSIHPSIHLEGHASPHVTHIFLLCFDCQAAQLPWSSANLVGKGTQTPTHSSLSHSASAQFLHPRSLGSTHACVWRRLEGSRHATRSESLMRNAENELYCIGTYPWPRHGRNRSPGPRIGSLLLKASHEERTAKALQSSYITVDPPQNCSEPGG